MKVRDLEGALNMEKIGKTETMTNLEKYSRHVQYVMLSFSESDLPACGVFMSNGTESCKLAVLCFAVDTRILATGILNCFQMPRPTADRPP